VGFPFQKDKKPLIEGLRFPLHSKAVRRAGIEENERSKSGPSFKARLVVAYKFRQLIGFSNA
jgi:hypothetical protein